MDYLDKATDELFATERERRQWCIEQAVMMEDVNADNLFTIAEKIYRYIWA